MPSRRSAAELAAIVAVFAAVIAFIHPRGNFPLIDDWDFAIPTWRFARTGHFHFTNFTAVSLRAMVLWGAAWTRLFGESFEVLRASTLTLSLATLLIVNRILALGGLSRPVRMAATLALLFHPLFLWLSCTYMTDVPFVFVSSIAIYAFVRALQEDRFGWLAAGCVAVVTAWFIRQNGVVLLLPPLALLVWRREGISARWRSFAATIAAFLVFFALLMLFKRDWLAGSPSMFATHYHLWGEATFRLPQQISTLYDYIVFNAQNAALFFLPLTLPLVLLLRRMPRRAAILLAVITLLVGVRIADLAAAGHLFPYNGKDMDVLPGNLFIDFAIGPSMLMGDFGAPLPKPFPAPHWSIIVLTALSAIVTIAMLWALVWRRQRTLFFELSVFTAAVATLALFASGYYYDRYSLDSAWMLVLALPLIVPWERKLARVLTIAALLALAFFSPLAVQEHFSWQRARWQAWNDLRARGIAVTQIDGGGEATGLYELADASLAFGRRGHPARPYAIALRPIKSYRITARYPFESYFGMRRGEMYVLAKESVSVR
jgi:dolichyl-phosphate-mannose-protein mannosyltransferase